MKTGDKIYTKKHIGTITEEHKHGMVGVEFVSYDNSEVNYNIVSLTLIKNMIEQGEWSLGERKPQ